MSAKIVPLHRSERTDEELLSACPRDPQALAALFDRYCEVVRGFLARIPGVSSRDVDDLLQFTFETVPRAAKGFNERSQVKTWICGVAYNVARHHIRNEIRRRRLTETYVRETSAPARVHPGIDGERKQKLHDAIVQLPNKLRETFVYVYIEGMSGTEVAELLGTKEGTVWKRLHEARVRLRQALAEVYP